jgi:carboxylesterase type B
MGQVLLQIFTNKKETILLTFSEDCLYLNIYPPANLAKNSRLQVSLWTTGQDLLVTASRISRYKLKEMKKAGDRETKGQECFSDPEFSFITGSTSFPYLSFPQ